MVSPQGWKGDSVAPTAGIVVAVSTFLLLVACAVKFIFGRTKKQGHSTFQVSEVGQARDVEHKHMVWEMEPAPPIGADFEPDKLPTELPTPILPDGSQVEYWSRTHNIWLPGVLHVVIVPGTCTSEPEVTYNVKVDTGGRKVQLRANVPIDSFRKPFAEGEPVEAHSASSKKWLPAVVDGWQGSPTLNGYRLVLTQEAGDGIAGRVLEKIPATHVRRRFHEGTLVARYMGPLDGFETGVVNETGAEPLGDIAFGSGLAGPSPSTVSVPDQSNSGEICQWSWVKYKGSEDNSSVVVPSFCLAPLSEV